MGPANGSFVIQDSKFSLRCVAQLGQYMNAFHLKAAKLFPPILIQEQMAKDSILDHLGLVLKETSAIDDIVVNSVALAFILQIDELLCSELM